jgi:hypothetical protein
MSDTWHFARPVLANSYLSMFDIGLTSARGLFARRRMGKTQFLNHDLLPAAKEKSYLTAYANLWSNKNEPGQALIAALHSSMVPHGIRKAMQSINRPIKKLKGAGKLAGIGEASFEADLDSKKSIPMTQLQQVLVDFDKQKKRLLLVVDEAQVLAQEEHSAFAHALRSALDIRKDRIKIIFAGSAETTLRGMFGRPSEPFYNWAVLEPFPLLGDAFVEGMVAKANHITKYPLTVEQGKGAFKELNDTPEFFRSFLDAYLSDPLNGAQQALIRVKEQHLGNEKYDLQWQALLPADKALLKLLANGVVDLHSEASLVAIGRNLGLEGKVTKNSPLNSLRRLTARNVVTKIEHGRYQYEDPGFAQWVIKDAP